MDGIQEVLKARHYSLLGNIGPTDSGSFVVKIQSDIDKKIYACKIFSIAGAAPDTSDIIERFPPPDHLAATNQNFVQYYSAFCEDSIIENGYFFVMDFCDGGSVSDIMRIIMRPLNEREINAIVYLVLDALIFLHSQKIVHNDIKAGNILFTSKGELKLSDTCIANHFFLLDLQNNRQDYLKPFWKPPEFFGSPETAHLNIKDDIWALGITMIEMITGFPPNHKGSYSIIETLLTKTASPDAPKDASKLFRDFVENILVAEPTKRPRAVDLIGHPFVTQMTKEQATEIVAELARKAVSYRSEKNSDDDLEEEEEEFEEESGDEYEEYMKGLDGKHLLNLLD